MLGVAEDSESDVGRPNVARFARERARPRRAWPTPAGLSSVLGTIRCHHGLRALNETAAPVVISPNGVLGIVSRISHERPEVIR